MDTTAHMHLEIELRLRPRLIPRTDNRDALVDLGFAPAYPQLAHDAYYGKGPFFAELRLTRLMRRRLDRAPRIERDGVPGKDRMTAYRVRCAPLAVA